jgi:subtilisin family serine protease
MRQIGMGRVWRDPETRKLTGQSVMIGHVDTGYTAHPALPMLESSAEAPGAGLCAPPFEDLPDLTGHAHGVIPKEGFDYFVGCPKPEECGPRTAEARVDPLDPLLQPHFKFDRQPGHGTGTLGMISAPGVCLKGSPKKTADRFLIGVAPGATIVPFRVGDGVIMTEDRTTRTAEAIYNAAGTQVIVTAETEAARPLVDVITISHGRRSPTAELEVAIRTAEQNGVIVVAASGELPFFSPVRFPAQYPTVVGVTGTKVDGTPWSGIFGAGRGPSAKVASPANRVWHAETVLGPKGKPCFTAVTGTGTSFSAPIVAGAAALWLEKYNSPAVGEPIGPLAKTYGLSAVPALFRHFLRPQKNPELSGFRSPAELCTLAEEEDWVNKASVCSHKGKAWDTHNWGQGVIAVDKLLAPRFPEDFPTPVELCREVYEKEGDSAFQLACGLGSPGRSKDETKEVGSVLEKKPAQEDQEGLTRLAGASFGHPFGSHAGIGPALDYALLFSRHYYRKPSGLVLQGQYGQGGNFSFGVGYGAGFGYDPYRDSKRSWSVIPGFGPAASIGVKAAYMRALSDRPGHANLVGAQVQAALLKIKGSTGFFRDLDNHRWRVTWDFGFGY